MISGHTNTSIANSLGASSIGIIIALGVPWTISNYLLYADGLEPVISLNGTNARYVIMALFLVSCTLFAVVAISKFKLTKKAGIVLMLAYFSFISYAVFAELGYIFPEPPYC